MYISPQQKPGCLRTNSCTRKVVVECPVETGTPMATAEKVAAETDSVATVRAVAETVEAATTVVVGQSAVGIAEAWQRCPES
jgi:hypothetical protein